MGPCDFAKLLDAWLQLPGCTQQLGPAATVFDPALTMLEPPLAAAHKGMAANVCCEASSAFVSLLFEKLVPPCAGWPSSGAAVCPFPSGFWSSPFPAVRTNVHLKLKVHLCAARLQVRLHPCGPLECSAAPTWLAVTQNPDMLRVESGHKANTLPSRLKVPLLTFRTALRSLQAHLACFILAGC